MANSKTKPVARKRRGYEYDHQYGLALTAKKTVTRRNTKRSAKKR